MSDARAVAAVAGLLGDESRAAMCLALLDAGRWTVSELAEAADVCRATASEHVVRLAEGGLVTTEVQGRHKYVSLAGPHVAEVLERLSALRDPEPPRSLAAVRDRRRFAAGRTCYDHLAGRLGVAVHDAMLRGRLLHRRGGLGVTPRGRTGSPTSASTWRRGSRAAGRSSATASTSPSDGRTWPARSARRCARRSSSTTGCDAPTRPRHGGHAARGAGARRPARHRAAPHLARSADPSASAVAVALLEPAAERLEVAGGLAAALAPLPLLADRGGEAELEDRVERLVGVGQHRAEQPVDLVGGDRAQRQPAVEVDVADRVDGERDAEHLQVPLQQPAVDPLVVLVGLAGHEGVHPERVLADVEAARRGELLLPGQLDGEHPVGDLLPGQVGVRQRRAQGLAAPAASRTRPPARSSRIDRAAAR